MITMVIGGFWHGAGANFIIWGFLHGAFLVINNFWRWICKSNGLRAPSLLNFPLKILSIGLTYICVVFAWVFFRAPSYDSAIILVRSMLGLNGISLPTALTGKLNFLLGTDQIRYDGVTTFSLWEILPWILVPHFIVWFLPNVLQIMDYRADNIDDYRPAHSLFKWRANWIWGVGFALLAGYSLLNLSSVSEFLYFQF